MIKGPARVRRWLSRRRAVGGHVQRFAFQAGVDALAWWLAISFATAVRYDFALGRIDYAGLVAILPLAAIAQTMAGMAFGLYAGRWRFGSFDEVAALVRAAAFTTLLLLAVDAVATDPRMVPVSAVLAGGVTGFALMGGVRYLFRLGLEARRRPSGEDAERLLLFGAGDGAVQVVRAMLSNPQSAYLPVALLDDDPRKKNLQIMGVRVVGTRDQIESAARRYAVDALLIAIPSADASLISDISARATNAGLPVRVLPPVRELIGTRAGDSDIREVTEADLLGRHRVETDVESIARYVTGRRVVVTGAGGSIGSELCRQLYRFGPARLIMVDRDESALHGVQLSIDGRALLDSPDLILLDLRDRDGIFRMMEVERPEVVFHTAALKHLPLLERHPNEAFRTNVIGTLDLLEASAASGVERFVNISTDKAADPCSVLGYSKRITERLTAHFSHCEAGTYLSVRFGNVLGSRGSVLTSMHAQIALGGPVTVTDPDVTRYFITVEEAVELVIQAGAIGRDGEVLVLEMGQPVRIADLAERLVSSASRPIDIVYTGLRPGEKAHEVLIGRGEVEARPIHPMISHVDAPPLDPHVVRAADARSPEGLVELMRSLCLLGVHGPALDA